MQTVKETPLSPRATLGLLALSIMPVAAYVLARQLGLLVWVRLGMFGVAALAGGVLFFTRPRYGVYFILFYLFSGLSFYLPGPVAVSVTLIVTAGVVLGFLRGDSTRLPHATFLWSIVLFTLIALQSMLWAQNVYYSARSFSQFFKSLLVLFLVVHLIRTPSHLLTYARCIFLGAVATVFFGLINLKLGLISDINVIGGVNMVRFVGAHSNPNYAAAYMVVAIPMGAFAIRYSKRLLFRVLAILGTITVVLGAFATLSRAAVFIFVPIALVMLFREVKNKKIYITVLIFLVIGILLTPRYYWVRLWETSNVLENVQNDWSVFLRYSALVHSWELFTQHPLTGIGLYNFIDRSDSEILVRIATHNSYFEILCGLGIFGLLAYLSVVYSAFRQFALGIKARWVGQNQWMGHFSFYAMLSFLAAAIAGFSANLEFNYLFWIPMAAAFAIGNLRKQAASK
jgi:O-antigen ligase